MADALKNADTPWQELRDAAVNQAVGAIREVKRVRAKTANQGLYLKAVETSTVTICTGPAGTGKTWMACGLAAQMLREGRIDRIVLTRPLVSCGQGYGFRPGTTQEKVMPVMRPLIEALEDFLGKHEVAKLIHHEIIELFPLDDMRGANIRNSFILCDEAQNAEPNQLHMLLTRFAEGSKLVITGDTSLQQTDLASRGENPLREVVRKFMARGVHPDISIVKLGRQDIVRHPLIQWIDETLSGDWATGEETAGPAKQEGQLEWFDDVCPGCEAKIWYEDDQFKPSPQVQCHACQCLIDLWDGDSYDPYVTFTRTEPCLPTFRDKV